MNLHIIVNTFYQKIVSAITDLRDMSKRSPIQSVHQPLWYLLTPCLLVRQLVNYEDSIKHRRGPSLPWTIRWSKYSDAILFRLFVQQ